MSERLERMKVAFGLVSDTDVRLLNVIADEIDNLENKPASDFFSGMMVGKMEGDDYGYTFQLISQDVCGIEMQPSLVGIEELLTSLRKKYAEGWRLAPPSSTVTVSPDLAALDEAMKRCYENIMTRWGMHNLCSVLDVLERGATKPKSGEPA